MVAMIASLISYMRDLTADEKAMVDAASEPSYKQGAKDDTGFYNPSPIDIFVVQEMLVAYSKLPPDVIELVLDLAEYWVCSSSSIKFQEGTSVAMGGHDGAREDMFMVSGFFNIYPCSTTNRLQLRTLPIGLVSDHGGEFETCTWASETEERTPLYDLTGNGRAARPVSSNNPVSRESYAQLANYPLPRLVNPVRKVVFKIRSRDQGWGGDHDANSGPYDASWTWFEAGLEVLESDTTDPNTAHGVKLSNAALRSVYPRPAGGDPPKFELPLEPADEWLVQKNKRAHGNYTDHEIVWSYTDAAEDTVATAALQAAGRGAATGNGKFVRRLAVGDIVTLWAKARFMGWDNKVENASVSVYWAI